MEVVSVESISGLSTEVAIGFESVSLFDSKFVDLAVEKTDGIIPVLSIEMNILEVTQSPPFDFAVADYAIEYSIKMDPAPYAFTTGDWIETDPWASPSVTFGNSYVIGQTLSAEISGSLETSFERYTIGSAETEIEANSDWAAGPI